MPSVSLYKAYTLHAEYLVSDGFILLETQLLPLWFLPMPPSHKGSIACFACCACALQNLLSGVCREPDCKI